MVSAAEPIGPVAIVGMGMKLPGGICSSNEFWNLLLTKKDARCKVPKDRFNVEAFYNPQSKGNTIASDYGYFLQDVDFKKFDAGFFSMHREEVKNLDPQQRLLLEVVWECMENAGQSNWLGTNTGCYVGVFGEDFHDMVVSDTQASGNRIANNGDFALANRIAYEYDLRGPSMTIRTSCSAALTCVDLACKALNQGDCSGAVVCGSNLILRPWMTIAQTDQGVLSPTGRCKTFDAEADGYARGEAITAVYIKRLNDAIRDGDPIRAVIRSTAINADGKTDGFSRPSSAAQGALIRRVYECAGIQDATDTPYVECHGTGTQTGDPIEAVALAKIFGCRQTYIGSVKTNLGHSEGASGLTSLIKATLALENEIIPANLHFSKPNPKVFHGNQFVVPTEAVPWPSDRALRVSINSFGVGGSNSHIIVDAAKPFILNRKQGCGPRSADAVASSYQLIVASAKSTQSLKRHMDNIKEYCALYPKRLSDVVYTLNQRREHLGFRTFSVTAGTDSIKFAPPSRIISPVPKIAFILTGQGAQWAGMGKQLYSSYTSFREDIGEMDTILRGLDNPPAWTIQQFLDGRSNAAAMDIDQARIAQPICTALQIALVNILNRFGIKPSAVVGHSSGEIAAAYAAGAMSMRGALLNAYFRGLSTELVGKKGAMAVVGMDKSKLGRFIAPGAIIACENSPYNITISGDEEAVETTLCDIRNNSPDTFTRRLRVSIGYHSEQMKSVGDQYERYLVKEGRYSSNSTILFFSSATGCVRGCDEVFDALYWRNNLENPVLFNSAVTCLLSELSLDTVMLEVGPHSALEAPLKQIFLANGRSLMHYASALRRNQDSVASLLTALGQLYSFGCIPDWSLMPSRSLPLTDLPRYPWDLSKDYWTESRLSRLWRCQQFPHHELLGSPCQEVSGIERSWRNMLLVAGDSWLMQHRVGDDVLFPFSGHVSLIGEAIRQMTASDVFTLRQVHVPSAMVIRCSEAIEIVTTARPVRMTNKTVSRDWFEFTVYSYNGSSWTQNCFAQGRAGEDGAMLGPINDTLGPCLRSVDHDAFYKHISVLGLNFGQEFRRLTGITAHTTALRAQGTVSNVSTLSRGSHYSLHPAVIDGCMQLLLPAMSKGLTRCVDRLKVPSSMDHVCIKPCRQSLAAVADMSTRDDGSTVCRISAASSSSDVVIKIQNLRTVALDLGDQDINADPAIGSFLHWRPQIDFLDAGKLLRRTGNMSDYFTITERLCCICILQIHPHLPAADLMTDHSVKHAAWIDKQQRLISQGGWNHAIAEAQEWASYDAAKRLSVQENIMAEVAAVGNEDMCAVAELSRKLSDKETLTALLTGKLSPLQVFMQDDALSALYSLSSRRIDCSEFLSLLAHTKPGLRVLEIGAGTGRKTGDILRALSNSLGDYSIYTFTDVSAGFFPAAKENLGSFFNVEFKVLDINKDPLLQGFSKSSYDLIIANNVLHATPFIHQSLKHVRQLLRPNGYILVEEILAPSTFHHIHLMMGFFPGWWIGAEDERETEPLLTLHRWDEEFAKLGLRRCETVVGDRVNAPLNSHFIVKPVPVMPCDMEVDFLYRSRKPEWAVTCQQCFTQRGFKVNWIRFEDGRIPADRAIISFLDLETPVLQSVSRRDYSILQTWISSLSSLVLWISRPSHIECTDPGNGLMAGLASVINSELESLFYILDVRELDVAAASAVFDVFSTIQKEPKNTLSMMDRHFAMHDGKVHVGRYRGVGLQEELHRSPAEQRVDKHLAMGRRGLLNELHWQQCDVASDQLGDDQVEMDIHAAGLNFKDLLIAMGIVDTCRNTLGGEAAGIVTRVGSSVNHVKAGDRVMGLGAGLFATKGRVSKNCVIRMPDTLRFDQGATLPVCFLTVIYALSNLGRLQSGQTVLIHSAAGGIGLAALQVCKALRAEILVTVGNEEKKEYLINQFGLPPERIFHSRNNSFVSHVYQATGGRGVDLVLNSLSGELLHASWQCVADNGKMIEIGKRDLMDDGRLSLAPFGQNRSFHGVDLAPFVDQGSVMVQSILAQCVDWLGQGLITPLPSKIFESQDMSDAFRFMQSGRHIGKMVLSLSHSDSIAAASAMPPLQLSSTATYLLVGGLGGLGRAVATWAVERGARNLVLFSRSAGTRSEDAAFLRELWSLGCNAMAVTGHVAKLGDVERAVKTAPTAIAGVIHMSMALNDKLFASMTYDEWNEVLQVKVQGTWNLHQALQPFNVDFFLLFGSISSIMGWAGQASYSAANSFQNSFVQFRHSLGLPCSIISIGIMGDIGYVSRHTKLLAQLQAKGVHQVQEQELLTSVEIAIRRSEPTLYSKSSSSYCNPAHFVLGLNAPAATATRGALSLKWASDNRFGFLNQRRSLGDKEAVATTTMAELCAAIAANPASLNDGKTLESLTREIGLTLCSFLAYPVEDFTADTILDNIGMDSLVSVEISAWWRQNLGVDTSVTVIAAAATAAELGKHALYLLKKKYKVDQ